MWQLLLSCFFAFLISMSLIFIIIEIRASFDRCFLAFGVINFLISIFCVIDIMIQPLKADLYWTIFQHVIASFFPPLSLWLVMLIVENRNKNLIKITFLASIIFPVMFLTGLMLKSTDKYVVSTMFYNFTFLPYIVLTQIYAIAVLVKKMNSLSSLNQKRTIYSYLIGMVMLFIGSLVDLSCVILDLNNLFPSFSILGALGFSVIMTIMFTGKLTFIIKEREVTFKKLSDAYRDLEEVQALKELGQSTAIINHEIRNYAAAISGYIEILNMNRNLEEQSKKIVNRISECIVRLTNFSNDILEFSKCKILKNKSVIDLNKLISECIEVHFPLHKNKFKIKLERDDLEVLINGDKTKLFQVFVNIFKNSIEAGAQNIQIGLTATESVFLCNVEDDGIGCPQEQVEMIFKSFYTTKKYEGGTGLGMCVVRSVIEVHGGHISAYSKNSSGMHGLSLNITFPRYEIAAIDQSKKHDVILIKDDVQNLASIFKTFQNVLVNPYVVQNVDEIDSKIVIRPNMVVMAAPKQINSLMSKYKYDFRAYVLVDGVGNLPFVVDGDGDGLPVAFNEEYIIKNILSNLKPAPVSCTG